MSKLVEVKPILALRPYTEDSGKIAKIINWWCKSKYYHVELILGDHWISATPDEGIYVKDLKPLDHERYEYLELPTIALSEDTYNNIWEYIKKQVSPRYDTMGLVWNQVFGISLYNKSWFCSELIADILTILGYPKFYGYTPSEYSPQDLYDVFTKEEEVKLRRYSLYIRFRSLIHAITNSIIYLKCKSWVISLAKLIKLGYTKIMDKIRKNKQKS